MMNATKFVYNEDGFWWYLTGKVLKCDEYWCMLEVEDAFSCKKDIIIPRSQIIESDVKGSPEELCKEFRSGRDEVMIDVFANGLCYTFAQWLQAHLYQSKIRYLDWEYHYVVWYQNRLYDVTGDVTELFSSDKFSEHRYCGDWKGK